jgi:hypothetical protein
VNTVSLSRRSSSAPAAGKLRDQSGDPRIDRDGPDDRARAAKLLEKALNDYRKFGMPSYAAETERMLRETEEG